MKDDVQNSQAGENLSLRQALRAMLDEGEHNVPSTTADIMASIRRERQTAQKEADHEDVHTTPLPVPLPSPTGTRQSKRSRRTLYGILALTAVAAVLIASFGLLSTAMHGGSYNSGATTNASGSSAGNGPVNDITRNPSSIPATTDEWSTVIITYKQNGSTIIANYDPLKSALMTLVSLSAMDVIVHGVSHKGNEVLYSVYDGSKTSYYIYPQATKDAIFTTPDRSRSAIWSTDDSTIFISTSQGVISIDVQTFAIRLAFSTLPSVTLLSYRENGYLYFIQGNTGQTYATKGTLSRINIVQQDVQQITSCPNGTNFWLSPSGTVVYYNCPEQNTDTLYAVKSDGAVPYVFRSHAGNVIGYAEDDSPLTLENTNGKYQVVRRDESTSKDTVLVQAIALDTTTITSENIAVAPYGHTLVAKAIYKNNTQSTYEQFWYSNLSTGNTQPFFLPDGASSSHVIGWDRLLV